jgi:hypothetical protein
MSITRRNVLAGAGISAGAIAVGQGVATAADEQATSTSAADVPLLPAAITASLDYLILGGSEFMGRTNNISYSSGTAGVFTSGTYIDCHFGLPVGSTLKEIEIFAAGTGSLSVGAFRVSAAGAVDSIGSVSVTGGSSGTMSFTELTDGNSVYLIEISGTSASLLFQTARVGFIPPYRRLVTVNPQVRVYNTRDTPGLVKFVNAEERVIDLSAAVPAGAVAAILNLTTTQQDAPGFLGLFPDGTTWPNTSSINYFTGQDIANNSIVGVSAARRIKAHCGGGATHVIVDVTGYLI